MKLDTDLIPCTVELERLKIFLRVLSQLKKNVVHRRLFAAKYYEGLPPYSVEELQKTPYERSLEEALEEAR